MNSKLCDANPKRRVTVTMAADVPAEKAVRARTKTSPP
jgi:hypothetical protein